MEVVLPANESRFAGRCHVPLGSEHERVYGRPVREVPFLDTSTGQRNSGLVGRRQTFESRVLSAGDTAKERGSGSIAGWRFQETWNPLVLEDEHAQAVPRYTVPHPVAEMGTSIHDFRFEASKGERAVRFDFFR